MNVCLLTRTRKQKEREREKREEKKKKEKVSSRCAVTPLSPSPFSPPPYNQKPLASLSRRVLSQFKYKVSFIHGRTHLSRGDVIARSRYHPVDP